MAADEFRPAERIDPTLKFASCKGIRIPESKKLLPVESGIQLRESGITLTIGIQNPGSIDKDWNPVPGNPESTAWNPESKSVLDPLTWGDTLFTRDRSIILLSSYGTLYDQMSKFSVRLR